MLTTFLNAVAHRTLKCVMELFQEKERQRKMNEKKKINKENIRAESGGE